MPLQFQFRRGNTSQNSSFTGAVGELSIDTTLKQIRLHDGSTAGGTVVAGYATTGSGNVVLATSATIATPVLTNPTITNYTETVYTATTSTITINLANGTIQEVTLNANGTITLPGSVAGKSFTVIVTYSGSYSLTWAGGSTLKWAGGTTPTATATSGKYDIFNFYQDGTNTYGSVFGLNF
jgi:hypothetical protein